MHNLLPLAPAPFKKADIAQLVEQRIRNAKVVGSTPIIAPFGVSTYPFKRLREARLCAALSQYVSGILAGLDVPVAYFYAEEDALTIAFHESRKQSV